MANNVVFTKTAKGREEIEARSAGLTPRQRRVLIFVDGKLTVDDLRARVAADDLSHTLGMLEEDGFIEMLGTATEDGRIVAAKEPPAAVTSFRPLPETPVTPQLDMARNFMMNTLRTFGGGTYTRLSLQDAIFNAKSHEELRQHFDAWYHAIVDSRDGRRRAEELRTELLAVI